MTTYVGRAALNRTLFAALLAVVALVIGTLVVRAPLLGVAMVVGTVGLVGGFEAWYTARLEKIALVSLGLLLLGYTFLDRGFAHVGVAPLFVGEMVLLLGLAAMLTSGGFGVALRSPLLKLMLVFAAFGMLQTIPYVPKYGIDALRDAVIWGYCVFSFIVVILTLRTGWTAKVAESYAVWLPRLIIWLPVAYILQRQLGDKIPPFPGSSVPLLQIKAGDMAVHLAGAGAFLLLGLPQRLLPGRAKAMLPVKEWGWWLFWLVGVVMVAIATRAGLLAIIGTIGVVFLLRPASQWGKLTLIGLSIAAVFFALDLAGVNVQTGLDLGGNGGRQLSVEQLVANFQGIFQETGQVTLDGTREWRLDWWTKIIDYTFFGEYFWTGKGFGINLAADDGFSGTWFDDLRNPHNGHLTVLARAGVPGLVLWMLLHSWFAASMLGAYFRTRRSGNDVQARLFLWVLAYWVAFMINASFDVFLEGPQQGIWFWSLVGYGIALLETERRRRTGARQQVLR